MAKAASRGKRKSSRRTTAKRQQGSILPWAAVAVVVVGGILAYDNWWKQPSQRPARASQASAVIASAPARSEPRKPAEARGGRESKEPKEAKAAREAKAPTSARASVPVPPVSVPERRPAPVKAVEPRPPVPDERPQQAAATGVFSTAFGFCGDGKPGNCVVDGDTFWHRGVKIRIAGIDAPQVDKPGCEQERQLGVRAKVRLLKLLNEGPIGIDAGAASGNSEQHTVRRNGRSVGNILISEGLAQPAANARPWC